MMKMTLEQMWDLIYAARDAQKYYRKMRREVQQGMHEHLDYDFCQARYKHYENLVCQLEQTCASLFPEASNTLLT